MIAKLFVSYIGNELFERIPARCRVETGWIQYSHRVFLTATSTKSQYNALGRISLFLLFDHLQDFSSEAHVDIETVNEPIDQSGVNTSP